MKIYNLTAIDQHLFIFIGTAKNHKFETLEDITVPNLKFWTIIDQTGTLTYNAAKVISDYIRLLCENKYSINDTQKFWSTLSSISLLQDEKENVSYDVESLFTNIPIEETANYIIEQTHVHKKLLTICSKLIFRRLLIKLAVECTFKFNSRFLKQVDGCTMGGPLSVTFSDIHMVKMESDVVILSKAIIYCRFVDAIYSRQKLEENALFH